VGCSATHVFPPKRGIALAAEDISNGVVASGHLAVHRLALNDVDTTEAWLVTMYRTMHAADTYTASKRYARPC
jgi:DNA gyrase inhibitor GyrI